MRHAELGVMVSSSNLDRETRQQYGFMRVYSRNENQSATTRRIDALAIYTATFYPILDWHLQKRIIRPRYVAFYLGLLIVFADIKVEEGFWNVWVWLDPEHADFFALFDENIVSLEPGSAWLGRLSPMVIFAALFKEMRAKFR